MVITVFFDFGIIISKTFVIRPLMSLFITTILQSLSAQSQSKSIGGYTLPTNSQSSSPKTHNVNDLAKTSLYRLKPGFSLLLFGYGLFCFLMMMLSNFFAPNKKE